MTLSDRDRKIAILIVPILLIVGYWFLLLAPKREEAATATAALAKQEKRLTNAQGKVESASSAQTGFASDYTQVVRLGKAIPPATDMPGLLVQLDQASKGTSVKFTKIAVGTVENPAVPPNTPPASGEAAPPAAAGGAPAESAPGSAAEKANGAAETSNQQSASAEQTGVGDTTTSTPAGGDPAAAAPAGPPAGLQTVPLTLEFEGNFFQLADFFHRVKRLVRTRNNRVVVSGRLITIEGVKYTSDPELFPKLRAELMATIYLVPAAQGTTAGATPAGPSTTTPAAAPDAAAAPPAATATPR